MQLCSSLSILWHCLSLGLEWKLTFSSPLATAEFSKFAGILSTALSQHHLPEYEIAHPLAMFVVMLSKAYLTSHSKMSGSRWVITPSWLSGSWRSFLYSSSVQHLENEDNGIRSHHSMASRWGNSGNLKEISPGCSLEGMMLKLKLQYFGHLMRKVDSLEKTLMLWGIGGGRKRGRQGMR